MRSCFIIYCLCIDSYRPCNHQEIFNLRHARLRNMIERIFGVLKRRFQVLLLAQEYSFGTQAKIIPAVAALHNFIIDHDPSEISWTEVEIEPDIDSAWGHHQAAVSRQE